MGGGSLEITLPPETLTVLKKEGYRLYIFRPIMSSNMGGVPLVCQRLDEYLETIKVDAPPVVDGYISTSAIAANAVVAVNVSRVVKPGERLQLESDGNISAVAGLTTAAVMFTSQNANRYTCGLAIPGGPDGLSVPFCAFDLHAASVLLVTPLTAVFVMFATSNYSPGAYMEIALGHGLYVKLDDSVSRNVSYDISKGWQFDSAEWAHGVPASSSLAASLIKLSDDNTPLRVRVQV